MNSFEGKLNGSSELINTGINRTFGGGVLGVGEGLKNIPTERNFQIILSTFGLPLLKAAAYRATQDVESETLTVATKRLSSLGTPVFAKLNLKGGSYKDAKGNMIDFPSSAKENLRMDTVLIEVSQRKNIVKTQLQGRDGTVKEYISDGDFDIVIRGIIVSEQPYDYPNDEVQTLFSFLKAKSHIETAGTNFLDFFGIDRIVVEDYSFPQREGFWNSQAFEIRAVSDVDYDLKIK